MKHASSLLGKFLVLVFLASLLGGCSSTKSRLLKLGDDLNSSGIWNEVVNKTDKVNIPESIKNRADELARKHGFANLNEACSESKVILDQLEYGDKDLEQLALVAFEISIISGNKPPTP